MGKLQQAELNWIEEIAKRMLLVETLETRGSDSLDFIETSVWSLKEALIEAYKVGKQEGYIDGMNDATENEDTQQWFKDEYGDHRRVR